MSRREKRQVGGTDWVAIRQRLTRMLEERDPSSREALAADAAVLDARARQLARRDRDDRPAAATLEVIVFSLAGERYGVETRHVREVVPLQDCTPVPGAPEFLAGISSIRGEIVMLIDLGRFFQLPARGLTDRSRAIVLGGDRAEFALLADSAEDVRPLGREELFESPPAVAAGVRPHLIGVTRDALVVLDGEALLKDPRFFVDHTTELRGASRADG